MIYIVTQYYLPLANPPAQRMGQLTSIFIEEFGKENVTVVTGRPNYPDGILPPEFRGKLFTSSEGPHQERIHHLYEYPAPFEGVLRKTLGMLTFAAAVFLYFLPRRLKSTDLVIVTTGPCFPSYALSVLTGLKPSLQYILDVRDLWPQGMVGMGILTESSWKYRLMDRWTKCTYRRARKVVGVSDGICRHIASVIPSSSISLIPNPINLQVTKALSPEDREIFRNQQAVFQQAGHRATVLFTGILSSYVGLENAGAAIKEALGQTDKLHFIFIGEGEEKPGLQQFISENKLNNRVSFLPFIREKDKLIAFIQCADVCFASLQASPHLEYAVPTKILEYLACNARVIVALKGAFADTLQREHLATVCAPGDHVGLAKLFVEAAENQEFFANQEPGRAFIEQYYSPRPFKEKWLQLVEGVSI